MKIGRASHTSTLLMDGRVLVAGGLAIDTYVTSFAETYSPVQNSFTLLSSTMTAARSDHTATLLTNGWVLIAGEELIGMWGTYHAARAVSIDRYFMQPVLVKQILAEEPLVRGPIVEIFCLKSLFRSSGQTSSSESG